MTVGPHPLHHEGHHAHPAAMRSNRNRTLPSVGCPQLATTNLQSVKRRQTNQRYPNVNRQLSLMSSLSFATMQGTISVSQPVDSFYYSKSRSSILISMQALTILYCLLCAVAEPVASSRVSTITPKCNLKELTSVSKS